MVLNVYAPQSKKEKFLLWEQLIKVVAWWAKAIVVTGDFNTLRNKVQRKNCSSLVKGMGDFNYFIEKVGLIEPQWNGKSFSWYGYSGKRSKIDRIFCLVKFLEALKDFQVWCLVEIYPIIVSLY